MPQLYSGDYAALRTVWDSLPFEKAATKLTTIREMTVTVLDEEKPWWEMNGFSQNIDWPHLVEAGLWQEPPVGVRPEDT